MVVKVGINGFGRIGRVIFRTCFQNNEIELSAINDPAIDIEYIAYLIKFDSTHGKFRKKITHTDHEIFIDDQPIKVFREKLPPDIPWQTAGVQYVVEASGMFTSLDKASGHLTSEGVKRVIVTAPSVDVPMIILGVNDKTLNADQKVLSCTSSTLYCLAPIIKVLNDHFGVAEGFVTSIHAMTPSLKPLDGLCLRGKHWRDHRSIHQNIIPASTGACRALGKIIPQVKDKMSGLAFRVPIVNVSVLDITIRLDSNTSLQRIVQVVEMASKTYLSNIIKISNEDAVSSDFVGDSHSCILDVDSSLELKPNFYKLICWYENEYSYACRALDSIFFSEKQYAQTMLHVSKMTYVRPKLVNKQDVVLQTENNYKEIAVACECNDDVPKLYTTSHNVNLKQKTIQKCRASFLRKQVSSSSSPDTPAFDRSTKKANEIFKIWNDDCEPSKNFIRQKRGSFFHSCMTFRSKPDDKPEPMKAQARLDNVKKEVSKMLDIAEDTLKKSESNQIQLITTDKQPEETIKIDINEKLKLAFVEDNSIDKTKHCTKQLISSRIKECGDFKNKVLISVDKNSDDTKSCNTIKEKDNVSINNNTTGKPAQIDKNPTDKTILQNTLKEKCLTKDHLKNDPSAHRVKSLNRPSTFINNLGNYNVIIEVTLDKPRTASIGPAENIKNELNISLVDSNVTNHKYKDKYENKGLKDIEPETSCHNSTCNTETSAHRSLMNKDDPEKCNLEGGTKYLPSKNYSIQIIDEELKKRIVLVNSDSNSNIEQLKIEKNSPHKIKDHTQIFGNRVPEVMSLEPIPDDSRSGSPGNTETTISNGDRKMHKLDLYDKLDSTSATDSNNSFEINGRKSQVLHITDLTNSLEDLTRLDKICRIIEISDELSDQLFSSLNNTDDLTTKQKWSFKDLCDRIQLDEFCNKVFGKTSA